MSKEIEDLMNLSDDEVSSRIDGGVSSFSGSSSGSNASNPVAENQQEAPVEGAEEEGASQGTEDQNQGEGSQGGAQEGSGQSSEQGSEGASDEDDDDDKGDDENDEGDEKPKEKSNVADPLGAKPVEKPKAAAADADPKAQADGKVPAKTEDKSKEPDYKALYEQVMKPFKANGREVTLQNTDEAIKLMQMGANYTKKMQALQPNMKILKMLENNQLLDEQRLGQFIDMTKGDKNAIAKFVKDTGVDPMDIDPDTAVDYKAGNHTVSDSEIAFQNIVDEVISTDSGQDLIIQVSNQWDQTSKKAIYQEPELVRVLARQKADGVYDQIAAEVEKQKMLGHPQIANLPFIHAYKVIGEALAQQGLLKLPGNNQGNTQKTNTELARAPAPTRNTVSNGAKAKAASPSGNTPRKAQQVIHPLAMSDEEFLKSMENRV